MSPPLLASASTPTDEVPPRAPGRLGSSQRVGDVLRHGRRRGGRQVSVHLVDDAGSGRDDVRLAVVASRRVGNAVARNRAKRLLREAGRRVAWPAGADVVLVARPAIAGADMWRVLDELTELADRITA